MVGDGVTFPIRIVVSAEAAIQGGNAGYLLLLFIRLHDKLSLLSGSRTHGFRIHFRFFLRRGQICKFVADNVLHGIGKGLVLVRQRCLGKPTLHNIAGVDNVVFMVSAAEPDDKAAAGLLLFGFLFHGYRSSLSVCLRGFECACGKIPWRGAWLSASVWRSYRAGNTA